MVESENMDLYELRRVTNRLTQADTVMWLIRAHFPLNELSELQWQVMESLADSTRVPMVREIVTYRLCQTIEHCRDNEVSMTVTRYLELNPEARQILLRKTVRLIPALLPLEMYLKSYTPIVKL